MEEFTVSEATQEALWQATRRGQLSGRRCIEDRPEVVEQRCRIGDWEADTIIGKNHRVAIVSLVERKSGLTLIGHVERNTAQAVGQAMIDLLKPYRKKVHTITSDNGREFACHQTVAKALKADFYFAHPHASWERGTNENTNGLIRQYFPKSSAFTSITQDQIEHLMMPCEFLRVAAPSDYTLRLNVTNEFRV